MVQIETKYTVDGIKECFYQMLLKWRLKSPENCNLQYLMAVLKSGFKFNADVDHLVASVFDTQCDNNHKIEFYLNYLKSSGDFRFETNEIKQKINQVGFGKFKNKNVFIFQKFGFFPKQLKLNQNDLWKVSSFIFTEWKSIGRYLGLNESALVLIEAKYLAKDGLRECCYQSLLQWNESNGSFYFLRLVQILFEQNLNFYALKLFEVFVL